MRESIHSGVPEAMDDLQQVSEMSPAERWPYLQKALRMKREPSDILFTLALLIEPEAAQSVDPAIWRAFHC